MFQKKLHILLDILVIPDFKNISSGEMMALAMFCAILKEFDRVSANKSVTIDDITGIVLIDEIDLHLHSDFAKEVLPNIIDSFPKIQFIVSSHSPFFLLGMNQIFGNRCKFLSLPNGLIMNNIENFEEIQKCYEMLDKNHFEMTLKLQEYEEKIKLLDKPLIITEGKTDWKHIKNALEIFKEKGEFTDLNVSFKEYEDADSSDSKLETLLINLARVNQLHKIIGIFDNDSDIGKKYLMPVNFGNNVWGCSLPMLPEYPCGISIEMLYNLDDIKLVDSEGRRLYMSNEFTENGMRLISDSNINTLNNAVKGFYNKNIIKIIDNEVYNSEGKSMALSKNDFAENIINRVQPFDKINVERFKGVFETLSKILTE